MISVDLHDDDTAERGRGSALVTIAFVLGEGGDDERTVIRHWYHVPRLNDFVALLWRGQEIEAKVYRVRWLEDSVVVWLA